MQTFLVYDFIDIFCIIYYIYIFIYMLNHLKGEKEHNIKQHLKSDKGPKQQINNTLLFVYHFPFGHHKRKAGGADEMKYD